MVTTPTSPGHESMTDALLAGLATEAAALRSEVFQATTNALTAMVEQQRIDREAFNRRNSRVVNALLVVAAVAALAIVAAAWGFWTVQDGNDQLGRQNGQLQDLAKTNRANTEIIRSCTTPEGSCAERAAAQQFVALASLVYCNRHVPAQATPDQVSACLARASVTFMETP